MSAAHDHRGLIQTRTIFFNPLDRAPRRRPTPDSMGKRRGFVWEEGVKSLGNDNIIK